MGYTIKIGEATIGRSDWQYEGTVACLCLPEAPAAIGDANAHANYRWPSYGGWEVFCRSTGLYDAFYAEETGLLRPHPGCAILTVEHAHVFREALQRYRGKMQVGTVPGFEPQREGEAFLDFFRRSNDGDDVDKTLSPTLARLEWLVWWTEWALINCKNPAMEHS